MNENEVKKFLEAAVAQVKRKALNIIAVAARKSIIKNFDQGGRPTPWKPSKKPKKYKGTKTLVRSGMLKNVAATTDYADSSVTLTTNPAARAYARIHQEGGTINMPARTLRFRKKKYKSGEVKTVFASKKNKRIKMVKQTKPYTITIRPRPYMVIPQEDIDAMINKISNLRG